MGWDFSRRSAREIKAEIRGYVTADLIELTNQPKPEVAVTAVCGRPIVVSGTRVTRALLNP